MLPQAKSALDASDLVSRVNNSSNEILMAASDLPNTDTAIQLARLRWFLNCLLAACCIAAITYAILWGLFAAISAGIATLVVTGLGIATLLARVLVIRGRVRQAVRIVSIALLLMGILATLISPGVMPVLIFDPTLVVVIALPYVDNNELRILMLVGLFEVLLIIVCARFFKWFEPLPAWTTDLVVIVFVPIVVGLIFLLLWQFGSQLTETLSRTHAANERLHAAQASLEAQVVERTAALQSALAEVESRATEQARLLDENQQQRTTIMEISVPVLPISVDTLVMPLIGTMDSSRLRQLHQQALHALEQSSARRLLLDITGVPVVDSQVAQGLIVTVNAGRLLGAEVMLVGIRPEVAQAIVGLGLNLSGIRTFSDLQTALQQE
jgi:rsbT co-antagonist protein RsbR